MKRTLIGVAVFVGLLVFLLVLLATFDWNRAKPWVNEKISDAAGRQFAINGDLSVNWERPQYEQTGWRRWLPWPHLRAHDVTLANPEWATTGPTMANVPKVDFRVNPLALLGKKVSIGELHLSGMRLMLEQDEKGRNNWTFPKQKETDSSKGSSWQLVLHDLILASGTVRYIDAGKNADVQARIDTLDDGSIVWKLDGTFNDEDLRGSGKAGALLSLGGRDVKYPVEARLEVGETTITANGTLTDPRHLNALDVELKILGASMADLFPLSGVLLPETPRFSTEGRVVGSLARDDFHLRYENFKGKVGSSDLAGTLEYRLRDPRPLLHGKVSSNYLNVADLSRLVVGGKKQKSDEVKQPPGKMLPVAPFRTERWRKMDAEVEFTGKKIVQSKDLPLDNLQVNVRMDDGVLSLAPLNFGVAGGRLTTELRIDGRQDLAKANMKISARNIKLKQLFPEIESMRASVGEIQGDAKLSAAGNSFAALLGSSNGELKSLITQGSISKFILEAMGLNIGALVATTLFGDEQVELNCMAADFGVADGLMKPRVFVLDTTDATIYVDGAVNLDAEKFDLTIRPESKGVRFVSLRSPLYVRGTFKNPEVGVDKETIAAKAGAAAALGAIAAPVAALLALINPGPTEDSPCGALLAQAKEKPKAPPPGKTAKQQENAKAR